MFHFKVQTHLIHIMQTKNEGMRIACILLEKQQPVENIIKRMYFFFLKKKDYS